MKQKASVWVVAGIVIILAVIGMVFFYPMAHRTYTLTLPAAEKLESIKLTQGTGARTVSDSTEMELLLDTLTGTERKTKNESIQDCPVNADNLIQIDFRFAEKGASTLFIYEKKNRFYIEQPYNGIYGISADEFALVENYILS